MKILITGGAGFIGSALIRKIIEETDYKVMNIDKLTYASNLESLDSVKNNQNYEFIKADINDKKVVRSIFQDFLPDAVMHLAAESHVDNSINSPNDFIVTNVLGTASLLIEAHEYWKSLSNSKKNKFKFLHVSTDEVYGDLSDDGFFTEETPYQPSSPYSASKASSDHLVRAWFRTFKLPTLITNCSNNFGPFQHKEKLIPKTILSILSCENIPVYGNGLQVRDWLFVEDHVDALLCVLNNGVIGETYNIGCNNEKTNLELIKDICNIFDKNYHFNEKGYSSTELISFVSDRPGHDLRYAIDAKKIKKDLSWSPKKDFKTGLLETVDWFYKKYKK